MKCWNKYIKANHDQQGESKRFGFGMMAKKKTHDFDDCTTSIKSTEKLLNNIKKKTNMHYYHYFALVYKNGSSAGNDAAFWHSN